MRGGHNVSEESKLVLSKKMGAVLDEHWDEFGNRLQWKKWWV